MRFGALALAGSIAIGGALPLAPAGATPPPTDSVIQGLQSKAASLAGQLQSDGEKVQIAAEEYDGATVTLQLAQRELKKLQVELVANRQKVAVATVKVRQAAVAAYVLGVGANAQFAAVLTKNIADSGTVGTYAGAATNLLHNAVISLNRARATLQQSEQDQRHQVARASTAAAQALTARNAANAATAADQSALSQVKGNLAQAVAQLEAQRAAEAEARARAAAQARARAAAEAEAQQAAAAAEQIAQGNSGAQSLAAAATASANAASSTSGPSLSPAGSSSAGSIALSTAESYLGVPYVWGGASNSGFDCSGLTMVAWAAAGVTLSHSAWWQYQETTHISLSQIEPGDLLFYYFPNDGSDPVTHVAMYVGPSGPDGTNTIIQAPETGETVSYTTMYYYGFVGAGRPTSANNGLA